MTSESREPETGAENTPDLEGIWELLDEVKDPEIPVVSIVELGIIRGVTRTDRGIEVSMTPTFTGCPALYAMQAEITRRLKEAGYREVKINISHDPPWSSDWITSEARNKLKSFGLAPPPIHHGDFAIMLLDAITCPYCGSEDTTLKNSFGSTLCRAIFYCQSCQQPFEQFKPL